MHNRLMARLTAFACLIFSFSLQTLAQPYEESSYRVQVDLSTAQAEDGTVALVDRYGTKILFSAATLSDGNISDVKRISVSAVNPSINGIWIQCTAKGSFSSDVEKQTVGTTTSSFIHKITWLNDPQSSFKVTADSKMTVTSVSILYDLSPRMFVNGTALDFGDGVMRNDKVVLASYVLPEGDVRYQYQCLYQSGDWTNADWIDAEEGNIFPVAEYFAEAGIPSWGDSGTELDVRTRIIYNDEMYYKESVTQTIRYIDRDREEEVAPEAPSISEALTVDDNNTVTIDGESVTFTLTSPEGTTIWYKVSDPDALLKVRSRSADIDESGYTDSQTNSKEFTVKSNCQLSYFSKHATSGLNSELSTLNFVSSNENTNSQEMLITHGRVMHFDLSGRQLEKAPSSGLFIKVEPDGQTRIHRN